MQRVQHWVQRVGDGAVMDVLGIGVMDGVMAGGLQEADVLEEADEPAVFATGAVGPFVDFVGVAADDGEEDNVPGEETEQGGGEGHEGHGDEEVAVALPPGVAGHAAGQMMVLDIGAADPLAHPGCVLADVSVFDPVDEAGGEIGGEDDGYHLQGEGDEVVHDDASLVTYWAEEDIDSL